MIFIGDMIHFIKRLFKNTGARYIAIIDRSDADKVKKLEYNIISFEKAEWDEPINEKYKQDYCRYSYR